MELRKRSTLNVLYNHFNHSYGYLYPINTHSRLPDFLNESTIFEAIEASNLETVLIEEIWYFQNHIHGYVPNFLTCPPHTKVKLAFTIFYQENLKTSMPGSERLSLERFCSERFCPLRFILVFLKNMRFVYRISLNSTPLNSTPLEYYPPSMRGLKE